MKRLVWLIDWLPFLLFFTLLHAGCSLVFAFLAYLNHKDPNTELSRRIATVLLSPLIEVQSLVGYDSDGFWLMLPNSFIWGLCVAAILEWCVRPRAHRRDRRGFPVKVDEVDKVPEKDP